MSNSRIQFVWSWCLNFGGSTTIYSGSKPNKVSSCTKPQRETRCICIHGTYILLFPTCKSNSAFSSQKASTNVQAYKAFLLPFTPSSKSVEKQCDINYVHIQNWRPRPVSHSISQFSFAVTIVVKSRFTLNKFQNLDIFQGPHFSRIIRLQDGRTTAMKGDDQEQTHSRKREKQQNWCSDLMVTMMCVALFAIAGVRPSTPKLHKTQFRHFLHYFRFRV